MLLASIFKPKKTQAQKTQEAYAQYAGTQMAAAGNYPNNKGPIGTAVSDIAMGLGYKTKDASYYARTERTKATAAPMGKTEYGYKDKYGNITNPALSPEALAARRGPTAAELKARRKAAELKERKRLGQIARKKFEKEKGERVAKKRALLLNIT